MKITHLGTAAAERIPALFCRCDLCRHAARSGGKEVRTQSQAVIDGHVLLDLPGDTYLHYLRGGLDLPAVDSLLITHWHSDHFYGEDLAYRMGGYALDNPTLLTVYGSATVRGFYDRAFFLEQRYDDTRLRFVTVRPGDVFELPGGYECRAFEANHGHHFGDCLFYAVTHEGRSMLYAHDTGFFPERTWDLLRDCGLRFDYVSLDCTHALAGDVEERVHMGFEGDLRTRDRMVALGIADERTVFVANHFSHNGRATYAELEDFAAAHGFVASYDGMTTEV